MKKSIIFFATAVLTLGFTACTHENLQTSGSESACLQVSAGVSTKAVGNVWSDGETIGVIVSSAPSGSSMETAYRNVGYVLSDGGGTTSATFTATDDKIVFDTEDNVSFVAYDPYYSGSATAYPGTDGSGVISGSTASQKTAQESIDYLYASAKTASSDNPEVNFTFDHVMARIVLNLIGSGFTASDVQGSAVTIDGLTHSGSFYVLAEGDHTAGTACIDDDASDTTGWSLNDNCPSETTASGIIYTAILYPHTDIDNVVLYVEIDGTDYYVDLKTDDITSFAGGYSYTYNITISEDGLTVDGSTITDWISADEVDIELNPEDDGDEEGGDEDDTVVYFNDFDAEVVSSNTTIKEGVTCYMNEKGTGVANVTYDYSSTMSVRTSGPSTEHYEGASGNNNIFFGNSTLEYFTVQNIALQEGKTDYTLSFGWYDSNNAFSHDTFKVYISEDGETWVSLSHSLTDGTADDDWMIDAITFTVPEGTETLYIYFESNVASKYRIDDVSLEVSETSGTAIDFSQGVTVPETGEEGDDSSSGTEDLTGDGSAENPYTIADTYILIAGTIPSGTVYVTGKVSQIGALDSSYGELTYYLSEDGTTTADQFEVYDGYGLNGERITSTDYLTLGDEIVVGGTMKSYNGMPEFNYGSTIYSINGVTAGEGDDDDEDEPVELDEKYVSNVTWAATGSSQEVNDKAIINEAEYLLLKLGAGSSTGSATCTLPVGTTSFVFYCVAWNNKGNAPFTVTVGGTELLSATANANSGMNNYSPFTIATDELSDSDYYTVTFDALTEETTLEIATTSTSLGRIGVFGAKYQPED